MEALSKAKVKLFSSLQVKKYRQREGLFIVESRKMVQEALASGWELLCVVLKEPGEAGSIDKGVDEFAAPNGNPPEILVAGEKDFGRISSQKNPDGWLAVIRIPEKPVEASIKGPAFLLDGIADPGNLGTIIRTADWFGFGQVICSQACADLYNPKVLRATMGSVFRVKVSYVKDLQEVVSAHAPRILAADLQGQPVGANKPSARDLLLLGNEAHGISKDILQIEGIERIRIPGHGMAESLNVAVSAGILAHWLVE